VREYAEVYKAVADETRLMILALILQHGECCVCDVMEVCGITQSKASRHLRYLKHAGLVDDRRDGTWVYYRMDGKRSVAAGEILAVNAPLLLQLQADEIARRVKEWNQRKRAFGACQKNPVNTEEGEKNDER